LGGNGVVEVGVDGFIDKVPGHARGPELPHPGQHGVLEERARV
jgi:hypothetical protein